MNKKQKANNPRLKPLSPRRIRQVRPEFFKSEGIADLSIPARLGFIGIWILCDKNGRFEWKSRTLKSDIFPHDVDIDFDGILRELENCNHVHKYLVDNKEYGQVTDWRVFQYIGPAESRMEAVYPEPPETFSNVLEDQKAQTF